MSAFSPAYVRKSALSHKKGQVIDIERDKLRDQMSKIAKAVDNISKGRGSRRTINLITVDRFLLASLFVLDHVDQTTLAALVHHAAGVRESGADGLVEAGMAILRRRGFVYDVPEGLCYDDRGVKRVHRGFRLTERGVKEFRKTNARGKWSHYYANMNMIDNLRCEVMSLACRGRQVLL